jgi:hypothetical protein
MTRKQTLLRDGSSALDGRAGRRSIFGNMRVLKAT